jgi:hypothetical protein
MTAETRKDLEHALDMFPRIVKIYIDGETDSKDVYSAVYLIFDESTPTFEEDCNDSIHLRKYLYDVHGMWDLECSGTLVFGTGIHQNLFNDNEAECVYDDSKGGWLL